MPDVSAVSVSSTRAVPLIVGCPVAGVLAGGVSVAAVSDGVSSGVSVSWFPSSSALSSESFVSALSGPGIVHADGTVVSGAPSAVQMPPEAQVAFATRANVTSSSPPGVMKNSHAFSSPSLSWACTDATAPPVTCTDGVVRAECGHGLTERRHHLRAVGGAGVPSRGIDAHREARFHPFFVVIQDRAGRRASREVKLGVA